jgi:hypothetical protein
MKVYNVVLPVVAYVKGDSPEHARTRLRAALSRAGFSTIDEEPEHGWEIWEASPSTKPNL